MAFNLALISIIELIIQMRNLPGISLILLVVFLPVDARAVTFISYFSQLLSQQLPSSAFVPRLSLRSC